ncbi:hypothetical protein Unana1_04741 [Umbelopsis nana]
MAEQQVLCEDCVTGFLKTGQTVGDIKQLGQAQAYFTPSSSHKSDKAIVVIGDIFGWEFINARLYADELARQTGFLVVLPDVMKGYALSADVLLKPPTGIVNSILHKTKYLGIVYNFAKNRLNLKDQDVMELSDAVLKDLRANYGIQSIGVHGPDSSAARVQAYAAGHPSFLAVPGDIENLDPSIPGFFQYAESDFMVPDKYRVEIDKISSEKSLNLKTKLYPATKHGFCLKSNEDDEKDKATATEATRDAAEFFSSTL